jgi:hypothetical protein
MMGSELLSEFQWNTFFALLNGPGACDFQQTDPEDAATTTWNCGGGMDKTHATRILTGMELPKSTIAAVLAYVEDYGGHCDCEILFNALERVYEDIDRAKLRIAGG